LQATAALALPVVGKMTKRRQEEVASSQEMKGNLFKLQHAQIKMLCKVHGNVTQADHSVHMWQLSIVQALQKLPEIH
jgi:hypothetical protein